MLKHPFCHVTVHFVCFIGNKLMRQESYLQTKKEFQRYILLFLHQNIQCGYLIYDKYPKIPYTNVPNKMAWANNADPDQTVWSGSTLFAIPLSILRNNCIKSEILAKKNKAWNKVFNLGHLSHPNYSDTLTPHHTCPWTWTNQFSYQMMCLKKKDDWMGNSTDPDQMPYSMVSDLETASDWGLHHFPLI